MKCEHEFIVTSWLQNQSNLGSRSKAESFACRKCLKDSKSIQLEDAKNGTAKLNEKTKKSG